MLLEPRPGSVFPLVALKVSTEIPMWDRHTDTLLYCSYEPPPFAGLTDSNL